MTISFKNLYFDERNRFLQFVCLLVCLVVSFFRWGEGVRYKDVEFLGDTPKGRGCSLRILNGTPERA